MQFVVIAKDGTDPEAPARRLAVREAHIANAKRMQAEGTLQTGGPILDDAGNMIGSVAIVQFDSRDDLDAWLESDPYVTGGVWRDIEVLDYRTTV